MVEQGAARFGLDATQQRADEGELFVLEPEAVHTGMAAVPQVWAYKVLYLEPQILYEWAERDGIAPRAVRWVVFRDRALRRALLAVHAALADEPPGLGVDEAVLHAVEALGPHLRPVASERERGRAEHAAVRRTRRHLCEQVRAVATAELDLAGLGFRAAHRDADAILRGVKRHP